MLRNFGHSKLVPQAVLGLAVAMLQAIATGAVARDYSLHMTMHVPSKCFLARASGLIDMRAASDGTTHLLRGLGRVRVICNSTYAVAIRRYKRRDTRHLRREMETAGSAAGPGPIGAVRVAMAQLPQPFPAPVASDAWHRPEQSMGISFVSGRPLYAASRGRSVLDRWMGRESERIFVFEVSSRL
ncbi:MAG: hypothetical protein KDJ37_00285 [Hyphomicrobiaceae bacterium]|nr:hypothetical protein [Hyphomicrobiaceae bacterium]